MAQATDDNPCNTPGTAHSHELVLRRVFDAPAEKVWRAYTEPKLLEQWFCPKPWTITDAVVELHPGGRFNFTMHGPDGEVIPNSGVVLEVVPGRRLTTTDALTPDWKPAGQPFMVGTVEMIPLPDGRTEYVATARHWSAETKAQHQAMGFEEGWGAAADQLGDLLKTL